VKPVAGSADAELACVAARKPAGTAAPLRDTAAHKAAADTRSALKTAVEGSAAAALPVDTTTKKQRNSSILCRLFCATVFLVLGVVF